jgi:hypothetical protein
MLIMVLGCVWGIPGFLAMASLRDVWESALESGWRAWLSMAVNYAVYWIAGVGFALHGAVVGCAIVYDTFAIWAALWVGVVCCGVPLAVAWFVNLVDGRVS